MTTPPSSDATLAGPLDGIAIVEAATHYAATPAAGAMLAELGARVIKIEPVTGDPYRGQVATLGRDNLVRSVQGKENLALNLKDAKGQEILHRLVAKADGFIHNFRAGVPERLGIDHDSLRRVNPKLVYQYGASYGSVAPTVVSPRSTRLSQRLWGGARISPVKAIDRCASRAPTRPPRRVPRSACCSASSPVTAPAGVSTSNPR